MENGNDYAQIVSVLKTMEDWDPSDRRPMIVVGKTTKGYWPRAVEARFRDMVLNWSATKAIRTA